MFILLIFVLITFVFVGMKEKQMAEWKGKIEYENGIKVIKNPRQPFYGEIKFELEEDLSIGSEDDDNYMFTLASDIEVDKEGNIYVLDSRECRIPKYRPFYSRIMKDDKGHIYVFKLKSILSEEKGTNFDLFSQEGYYLYKVKIHDVIPRIVKKGFIYAISSDPDTGYYKVKRYRIKNWDQIK